MSHTYRVLNWRALARRVIVVATEQGDGSWRAYIDAVPGQNHDAELEAVIEQGVQLQAAVALALFPALAGRRYDGR